MSIINTLGSVVRQTPKYKKWEEGQQDKEAKRAYLAENTPILPNDLKEADKFGRTVINAINVMDEKSEDAATKTETTNNVIIGIAAETVMLPISMVLSLSAVGGSQIKLAKNSLIVSAITVPLLILGKAWGTSREVLASKIAREKARETELKDPKNFVIYNDAQIEAARKKADSKPIIKETIKFPNVLSLKEAVTNLINHSKDKRAYEINARKRAVEDEAEEKALKSIKATPEQLAKAEKTQETVLRLTKTINNKAEDYSENIESATGAGIALASTVLAGVSLAVGGINAFMNKGNLNNKKIAQSFLIGGGTFLAGLIGEAAIAQNMKLNAAKVGRFKVKQELLSDPKNFVSFTDNEINSAGDIKAPKEKKAGFFKDLFSDLNFLWQSRKDFKAYNEYKKHNLPKDKAFMEELTKSEVSKEQLAKAKNLQHKLFNVFERIDDKSQEYSEDVEFATEAIRSMKDFVPIITGAIGAGAAALLVKTKIVTPEKASNLIANVFFKKNGAAKEIIQDGIHTLGQINKNSILKDQLNEKIVQNSFNKEGAKNIFHWLGIKLNIAKPLKYTEAEMEQIIHEGKALTNQMNNIEETPQLFAKLIENASDKIHNDKDALAAWDKLGDSLAKQVDENSMIGKLTKNILKDVEKINELAREDKNALWNPFNYKWIAGTAAAAGTTLLAGVVAPFIAVNFAINYAIESFFTSIQKTAGKIGVMEAINGLDDPRAFVDESDITKEQKNDMNSFMKKLNKAH